jgi:hypothetical protein
MKYEIRNNFYFVGFILHSSFFILHSSLNFAKQNSFGRAASLRSRRAIRSITRGALRACGWFRCYPSRRRFAAKYEIFAVLRF